MTDLQTQKIKLTRGVRQACPLSSLLSTDTVPLYRSPQQFHLHLERCQGQARSPNQVSKDGLMPSHVEQLLTSFTDSLHLSLWKTMQTPHTQSTPPLQVLGSVSHTYRMCVCRAGVGWACPLLQGQGLSKHNRWEGSASDYWHC